MLNFKREIEPSIEKDLGKKIILLSGPRQTGKTTLAKGLSSSAQYFNYDSAEDRILMAKKEWNRAGSMLILDELHKMKSWKRWLKGIYDKEGLQPPLLVTGSARLDISKKMGDSLAGRFFGYRLYPLDIRELRKTMDPKEAFYRLMKVGGFPEPFFENDEVFYGKWAKSHLDLILRQDLLDLENVRQISALETLIEILSRSVGSTVSYSSLGRQLERDAGTIKRWLLLLENLFVIFKAIPYTRSIQRAILKEPKYYFYDLARVKGDAGARFENLVALSIHKYLHFREDVLGRKTQLHFLRNKEKKEVDFLCVENDRPQLAIECKWSDQRPSENFREFRKYLPNIAFIQLVGTPIPEFKDVNGFRSIFAPDFLSKNEDWY